LLITLVNRAAAAAAAAFNRSLPSDIVCKLWWIEYGMCEVDVCSMASYTCNQSSSCSNLLRAAPDMVQLYSSRCLTLPAVAAAAAAAGLTVAGTAAQTAHCLKAPQEELPACAYAAVLVGCLLLLLLLLGLGLAAFWVVCLPMMAAAAAAAAAGEGDRL
jgi:hypothetical protein